FYAELLAAPTSSCTFGGGTTSTCRIFKAANINFMLSSNPSMHLCMSLSGTIFECMLDDELRSNLLPPGDMDETWLPHVFLVTASFSFRMDKSSSCRVRVLSNSM